MGLAMSFKLGSLGRHAVLEHNDSSWSQLEEERKGLLPQSMHIQPMLQMGVSINQ